MPRFVGLDHVDAYFVANLQGDTCRLTTGRRGGRRFSCHRDLSEALGADLTAGRTALSYFIKEESAAASGSASLADALAAGLSPERASLVRAVLAEQSLHSIAEEHGISVQAVSQQLARLRRHFPQLDQWWLARHANRQGGRSFDESASAFPIEERLS